MNDLLPLPGTATIEELIRDEGMRSRQHNLVHSSSAGSNKLDWWVTFSHPRTLTESEAKKALFELLAESVRAQCHLIIHSLPNEILPTILPQLQEMAEYELRIWTIREKFEGPDIHERWLSLPMATQ